MSIVRARRDRNYSVMSHSVYADNRLSFQAMGLLSYILSKPDNWTVNIEHLVGVTQGTQKRTGKDGVYAILKELKDIGFVEMKKHASGKVDYFISDMPAANKTHSMSTICEVAL
ncbi:hypothetical protein [Vibrio salinus]|uniref:hypothetical protein n=1 Tax=Vibrio salinus TaxID=2899784 RepID=UPI001E3572FE|nr:hypothetical protein [Vibrio salinus]MCE0495749.1 hypothetical protein [Vibrio salinus]